MILEEKYKEWFPNWKQFLDECSDTEKELVELIDSTASWDECAKRTRVGRQIYNWMVRTGQLDKDSSDNPFRIGEARERRLTRMERIEKKLKELGLDKELETLRDFRTSLLSGKFSYCEGNSKAQQLAKRLDDVIQKTRVRKHREKHREPVSKETKEQESKESESTGKKNRRHEKPVSPGEKLPEPPEPDKQSTPGQAKKREEDMNTVVLATRMVINRLGDSFQKVCDCYTRVITKGNYKPTVQGAENIVTWGVKMPITWYRKQEGKTFLFIENGLLKQKAGIYVDRKGWFGDSSICDEVSRDPSQEEVDNLQEFMRKQFKKDLYEYEGAEGPVMFAMQMRRDMGPRYYSDSWENIFKRLYEEYGDEEVILRPHPREKFSSGHLQMGDKWRIEGGGDVYEKMAECRKVISVNSTLLTEAAALGLEVEPYGTGAFTGYNLSDKDERTRYLCNVLRHQIPYKASPEEVYENEVIKEWLENTTVINLMKGLPVDSNIFKESDLEEKVRDDPVVVSFGIEEPARSSRKIEVLRSKCTESGVELDTDILKKIGNRKQTTYHIPAYVMDKLQKHRRPVLWVGPGSNITANPVEYLKDLPEAEVYTVKSGGKHRVTSDCILFPYRSRTLQFLKQWKQTCHSNRTHDAQWSLNRLLKKGLYREKDISGRVFAFWQTKPLVND